MNSASHSVEEQDVHDFPDALLSALLQDGV